MAKNIRRFLIIIYTIVMRDSNRLTPQQTKFVKEYLVDHNGSASAIRAGYSKNQAWATANTLLEDPKIQKAIRESARLLLEKKSISAASVLEEIKKIGFDRDLQPSTRLSALELLGRYLGIWKDKLSVTVGERERREIVQQLLQIPETVAQVKEVFEKHGLDIDEN